MRSVEARFVTHVDVDVDDDHVDTGEEIENQARGVMLDLLSDRRTEIVIREEGLPLYILIGGNPVDGFVYMGPFDSRDEAISNGDELSADWWIAPLVQR